jgi:hypothetical protein
MNAQLDTLLDALDRAIQTREAADTTGWTNHSSEEAHKMVADARHAIHDFMAAYATGKQL